jgi:hypothetical protein
MQRFNCDCGNRLFFENSYCLLCAREVSWCPKCASMTALELTANGLHCARCKSHLSKCANWINHDVCNRSIVVPEGATADPVQLCDCCRYNNTIPDLSVEGNKERWHALEQAKRRLIHGLDSLGLPHGASVDGFELGLSFDFKDEGVEPRGFWRLLGERERVFTGHANGKITINIREADPANREQLRVDLGEGHRTLIGHFRHEIGHYYWNLLIKHDHDELVRFKAIFGDHENPDYSEAMDRHYKQGAPPHWRSEFISAYASMHPWEDWAETFAFYLDIVDVMETVQSSALFAAQVPGDFRGLVQTYSRLGVLLNELNRAMGLIDFLPEVVVPGVFAKLELVHDVIRNAAATKGAQRSLIQR